MKKKKRQKKQGKKIMYFIFIIKPFPTLQKINKNDTKYAILILFKGKASFMD